MCSATSLASSGVNIFGSICRSLIVYPTVNSLPRSDTSLALPPLILLVNWSSLLCVCALLCSTLSITEWVACAVFATSAEDMASSNLLFLIPIRISALPATAKRPTPTKLTRRMNIPRFPPERRVASAKSRTSSATVEIVSIRTMVRFLTGRVFFQLIFSSSVIFLTSFSLSSPSNLRMK